MNCIGEQRMKPEEKSKRLLGATRSKAKMIEYGVEEEYHIKLPKDPSNLFSLAIGLLGDISAHLNSEKIDENYLDQLRNDLQFSAHFFDAYLQSNLRTDMDKYILLLGSASYYLCDLPGSSFVLVSRINNEDIDLECSNLDSFLIWVLIGDFTYDFEEKKGMYNDEIQKISKLISYFFNSGLGEKEIRKEIQNFRYKVYQYGNARELLFADVISAVIIKKVENSSWNCLPYYTGIPIEEWKDILKNNNFIKEFWPAQHLLGRKNVYKGKSAIVQLPTSAGKTKATEVIIRSAFLSRRASLAVIVAPFKALCHEISDSLNKSFQNDAIYIDELSDTLQIDFDLVSLLRDNLILVVTPEKLIYMLRHFPDLAQRIGLLIYDEGHQFDSGSRGINYELLLTSLKSMVPESTQKILISAVISNADIVGSWLNGKENKVISGINLTPTYRTVAFTSWLDRLGRIQFVNNENPDEGDFFVPRIIEQHKLKQKGREKNERFFPEKTDSKTVSLFLGLRLISKGSVAIFCGKKNSVSGLCEKVIDAYERGLNLNKPYEYSDVKEINKLHYLYESHLGLDEPITKSAKLGILTHHGNIPSGLRIAVEYAMKEGLAKFVICTSTLAQGVNLPIRYLIVTSIYQGINKMKVRDFHNLIGRVGRSGMHTEGSILFADSEIYDKRSTRKDKWRWKQVKNLLDPDNSEPVGSSLITIFDPLASDDNKFEYEIDYLKFFNLYYEDYNRFLKALEKISTLYAKEKFTIGGLNRQVFLKIEAISSIESYLMANWEDITKDNEGNLDETKLENLVKGTLAYSIADVHLKKKIVNLFNFLAQNISESIPQTSRKKLFGKMLYGLKTARMIEEWTKTHLEELKSCNTIEELLCVLWPLLLSNSKNKILNNCEKPEILKEIALGWLNGKPYVELLKMIKERDLRIKTKKQSRKFSIDNVVEICDNAFSYEGMLLIGAVAELVESLIEVKNVEFIGKLRVLQKRIKYGLPNSISIMLYEIGFADRVIALDLSLEIKHHGLIRNKRVLKKVIKRRETEIRKKIIQYPSYFTFVLEGIL
jgi:POLQ-like helicase